jgi:hypothetical protein
MATARLAMAIPVSAPADSPLPLELDELLVGFEEGNGAVVDPEDIDGEVIDGEVIDGEVIDGETITDVADIAASGFPHWVGMN